MFKRIIDLHLDNWRKESYRKPLMLRGARQVGKTWAVRRLGQSFEYFVEVNFEKIKQANILFEKDLEPQKIIAALSLLMKTPIEPGKTLLFFDEIQECPQAIIGLRYFYEEMPSLHVIAAGSLLEFAIEKVGVPVGRISMLYMHPMSFLEYLVAIGDYRIAEMILQQPVGMPMEEPIHTKILDKLGEYLSIGGMPEVVARWVQTQDPLKALEILHEIAEAYQQDFEKYARKSQIKYLAQLFRQIPHMIAQEFSYKEIHGEYRKRELAPALQLLEQANIIHTIRHTSGQGIPIGSEVNFEVFKVIYLDVALAQVILGVDMSIWFLNPLQGFENRGDIAEAFIGQELLCYSSSSSKAQLYFWKKKEKNSQAEVDYLVQNQEMVIPVEVKSSHGSKLTSLRIFLESHPKSLYGIRFSSLNYSVVDKLDSRPLYAAVSLAHESQRKAFAYLVKQEN